MVMASLILVLNAFTRLDQLRQQNERLQSQMELLQAEYAQVQASLMSQPEALTAPPAKSEKKQTPFQILQGQLQQIQSILEAYIRQHDGAYPPSLKNLIQFTEENKLQKTATNPYTQSKSPLLSEDHCLDITHDPADEGLPENAGKILFQAHLNDEKAQGFTLAAFDKEGLLLKTPEGQVLTLTQQN